MTDIVERFWLLDCDPWATGIVIHTEPYTCEGCGRVATEYVPAAEVERLRTTCRDQAGVELSEENDRLIDEVKLLRAALNELTTEITGSAVLMDNISLAKFERACRALEPKP